MSSDKGWIGVDLDGTLAHYDGWKGADHIGAPVPAMVARVKRWLEEGREVRIFTARVGTYAGDDDLSIVNAIADWCKEHLGQVLDITATKDFGMLELWDDRCVQVEPNTGRPLDDPPARIIASAVRNYLDIEDPEKFVDWLVMAREIIRQHNVRVDEAKAKAKAPAPAQRTHSEVHVCPRRSESGGFESGNGLDVWRPDDTCSWCGSLDPAVFMARLEAGDVELEPTDKSYKVYTRNAGGEAFKSPTAKFYFQHLSVEQRKRFVALFNERRIALGFPGHFYVSPFFMAPVNA